MDNPRATPAPLPATASHFEQLGGRKAVTRLVDAFYQSMDSRSQARTIRAMHDADLGPVREVLVLYLCEWLGGPKDYSARRGHPRLRARHLPFAIGADERDAWLDCMREALDQTGVAAGLQAELMQAFHKTADWMRNPAVPTHRSVTIEEPK